jgi:hypothetical protein
LFLSNDPGRSTGGAKGQDCRGGRSGKHCEHIIDVFVMWYS